MTATYVQLQPMERAIVIALRDRGPLTTTELAAELAERGYPTSRVSVRARLATLARFGVLVRETEAERGPGGAWESRYRLRV